MATVETPNERRGLLARLALDRPELRAWALYDWANSAMITVVVTAIYPIYFLKVAAADSSLQGSEPGRVHALATAAALLVIALIAPALGAVADRTRAKKRFLTGFTLLGAFATAGLAGVDRGEWGLAAVLFMLANIGASGSFVFYDSLLPHVARDGRELDRLSTSGYALGYLGGGLVLALCLATLQRPELFGLAQSGPTWPTRIGFLIVAVWWLAFTVPLLRRVPEPLAAAPPELQAGSAPPQGFHGLVRALRELAGFRQALLMLIAFLVYNDGIITIYRMGVVVGEEIGIPERAMIGAILMVQFLGIPCTFAFGALGVRIGSKRAILVGLMVYMGTCILGASMRTEAHFWLLAASLAFVQGGTQALSRSLFASLVPKDRSAEFFGVFAVLDRFGAILGPLMFAGVSWALGGSRPAVLSLGLLFVVGALLLTRVDVAAGRAEARATTRP